MDKRVCKIQRNKQTIYSIVTLAIAALATSALPRQNVLNKIQNESNHLKRTNG
jgi:hypothetical protein